MKSRRNSTKDPAPCKTLNDCGSIEHVLNEAREEICCLEQKNNQMENALSDLQKWLNDVNCSENNQIKPSAGNVSMGMQTSFADNPNENENENLKTDNLALRRQLRELKTIINDLTENKMQGSLSFPTTSFESRNKHSTDLKKRLSDTSLFVHQFVQNQTELNQNQQNVNLSVNKSQDVVVDISNSSHSILDSSSVDDLQRQLTDALEKNTRWQTYNSEREQYVASLLAKYNDNSIQLQDARQQLALVTSNPDKLAVEQRRYFDKLLVDARQELATERNKEMRITTELSIVKEEAAALKNDLEKWRGRYEEQREANAALNANYESERRRSNNNAMESKEKQSQIQLLQRQVQLFSEDFRSERKEKEGLEIELKHQRKKIDILQKKVDHVNKKKTSYFNDILCDDFMPGENLIQDPISVTHRHRRGVSPPKRRQPTSIQAMKEELNKKYPKPRRAAPIPTPKKESRPVPLQTKADVNSSAPKRRSGKSAARVQQRVSNGDSMLQCPNCGKEYDINEHMSLIAHIDLCE